MIKRFTLPLVISLLASCSGDAIKEKINKAGDIAGQTAGEFIEGASKGVQKAFDVKIELPENLKEKGLEFGKAQVTSDTLGTDNLLVLYLVFNKDFDGKLMARVFDEQSLEMGRSAITISGKKDDAKYIEFHFDPRTNMDSKNKITIE